MGLKLAAVFVKPAAQMPFESLLFNLGIPDATPTGKSSFQEMINPDFKQIGIGYLDNILVLCSWEASEACLSPNLSVLEQKVLKTFPNSEIAATSLMSTIDHWGLSLVSGGAKKRVFFGSADEGIECDSGEELEIEPQFSTRASEDDDDPPDFEGLVLTFAENFCNHTLVSDEIDLPMETWALPESVLLEWGLVRPNAPAPPPRPQAKPTFFQAWKQEMSRQVSGDELNFRIKRLILLAIIGLMIGLAHYFLSR